MRDIRCIHETYPPDCKYCGPQLIAEEVGRSRRQHGQPLCAHFAYTQNKVTGECTCDQCGKLLIDSIGRVQD